MLRVPVEVPPPVRYVPRRGKNLAYRAYGAGRRVVLSVLEMPTHLDLMWTDPHWIRQAARLAERCRVISFQQMGLGLSDAIDRVPTLEEQAEDIAAVMDAEGVASAIMCGTFSTAMPVVLLAANAPERVEALVLQDPYAQGWRSAPYEEIDGFTPAEARGFALAVEAALTRWGEGRLADLVDSVTAARNRTAVAMLERCSATPATAVALYEAAATSDVRATLPLVRAPTRVLHRPTFGLPESASRVVAGLMPNATYHLLPPTQPHTTYAEALAPVFDHLLEVVDGASHTPGGHRQLATILFTDVVGSTETARATGDLRWDRLLERHETRFAVALKPKAAGLCR